MKKFNATAIILAGGNSSRMNGEDKSLLLINGKTMIEHIVYQLENYFTEIIIGTNNPGKYTFLNKKIVTDIEKNQGPLMGILSCLKASKTVINFITACDIPQMNIDLISDMMKLSVDYQIIIPQTSDNKLEPLFAVYQRNIITKIEENLKNNDRKIINILTPTNHFKYQLTETDWYKNLNYPNDYLNFIANY